MVLCCNRLKEIGNYTKVRRIKDVASVYGDNKDTCGKNGRLRTHWTKGENRIKYENVEGEGCHGWMPQKDVMEGCHGRMSRKDATEGCHRRMPWKDVTEGGSLFKARKKRGYSVPDEINTWIIFV